MAREVRNFAVTVPNTTPIASPITANLTMPARQVDRVKVRVPPGPGGTVGFALALSGVPIIPWQAGQWIVADNEVVDLPLEGYPSSGAWQLRAYNTGVYDHTLYVLFYLELPQLAAAGAVLTQPLDLSS